MNTSILRPTALALVLSSCLLGGCGGGESSFVRPTPPPDPPPPPSPTAEACPAPVTADCVVVPEDTLTWDEGTQMTGGRQSDHALTVKGTGILHLKAGDYRFSGGTTILDSATLLVWDTLISDVHVTAASDSDPNYPPTLWLAGTVHGDVVNEGAVTLRHTCGTGVYQCAEDHHPTIDGNYRQSASGELDIVPGWNLQVSGHAALDGKLVFINSKATNYVLPDAPASFLVLHAGAGVSGQFASWTSDELLLTGALRYQANDVYFDAATISAAQAMAASTRSVDALTLQSAAQFDAALGNAGTWAHAPATSLTATQSRFLASVGAVQRLQDYDQAIRTFDSLSGHGYVDAADSLLRQAALPGSALMARVGSLHPGSVPESWATGDTNLVAGAGAFNAQRAGFDAWFGKRLLLGSSFGVSDGSLRFDRNGGNARDRSPQWDAYVRLNGDAGTYVFGDVGYASHQWNLDRRIDLGVVQRTTRSVSRSDVMSAYVETGRDFRVGPARLTPFTAVSYAVLRDAGFVEQGSTGFELVAQPATYRRLNAAAGVRVGSEWRTDSGRRVSVNLAAGYLQVLQADDNARAAFAGTPGVTFTLDGLPLQRHTGWMQMTLATGDERWNWQLSYDRQDRDQALSLGATFGF